MGELIKTKEGYEQTIYTLNKGVITIKGKNLTEMMEQINKEKRLDEIIQERHYKKVQIKERLFKALYIIIAVIIVIYVNYKY